MRPALLASLALLSAVAGCCPKGHVNRPKMFGGVNCVPEVSRRIQDDTPKPVKIMEPGK